ncbi:MAG: PDZ domain-containing protein, partial [Armatimonadetes bacterium]|nr:PDZ domain-containing protein [Anaerolineae bacterium]
GSNSGIGYSIPSVLVQRVAQELIANGSVDYSFIGIQGSTVDIVAIEALTLPDNQIGAIVGDIVSGGPAARAGLQPPLITQESGKLVSADIITAINGTPLTSGMDTLIAYLARYTKPGDQITLTVLRGGELLQLPLTLGSRRAGQ